MTFYKKIWEKAPKLDSVQQILDDRALTPMTIKDLHDPFLLLGMREAVQRINTAISEKEQIWIFGDYDVDGITSCAILVKYLENVGGNVNYYIPNRKNEGYGLSKTGLDYILSNGGKVVITVDCGINAFDEAEYAKEIGLDLIVTDHHSIEDRLPQAIAVVNPKREGYPFRHLAGCGVALKVVQALAGEDFEEHLHYLIEIAAIGTIADIVSLTGENRVIVTEGLANINNIGLRSLIEFARKDPDNLTSSDVGFGISPMINASGRIGNPRLGVELFLCDDPVVAGRMAKKLYHLNNDRKNQCQLMTEEAIRFVEEKLDLNETYVIVVRGEKWHSGIIGIVASRLTDIYHRPVVVLTKTDEGLKGSSRSVGTINIYKILAEARQYMLRFGGHDLAAGLTLKEECYEEFCTEIQKIGKKHMGRIPESRMSVDYAVEPQQITMKFIEELGTVEPFGMDNKEPCFLMENIKLGSLKTVGAEGIHVKTTFKAGMGTFDGIAFRQIDSFKGLRTNDELSILFIPEISSFRGTYSINLRVQDIHSGVGDFHPELQSAMDRAMTDFLMKESSYHFTRIDDFDIIKELESISVYTYEEMRKIQKVVYDNDIKHRIIFRDETVEDCVDENDILTIRFMPTVTGVTNATGTAFLDYIPVRKDVERVYLTAKKFGIDQISIPTFANKLRINVPKLLLSFELLKELRFLEYRRVNDFVYLDWKQPEQVEKLESMELFKKLERETRLPA